MSGGHFDYQQHTITIIADSIEHLIETNDDKTLNDWGEPKGRQYKPIVIVCFKMALETLRRAQAMTHRIDWLVSGDDDEGTFLKRWKEDLRKLENESNS